MLLNIFQMSISNFIFSLFMLRLYEIFKWVDKNCPSQKQNQYLNKIQNFLALFVGVVSLFWGMGRLIHVLTNLNKFKIQNITFDQIDLWWWLITGLFYLLSEVILSWLTFKKNFKEETSEKMSLFSFLKNKNIGILFNLHSFIGVALLMFFFVYFL